MENPFFGRRQFLLAGALALPATGCFARGGAFGWRPDEKKLLEEKTDEFEIVTRESGRGSLLRRRTREAAGLDLAVVARRMENTMKKAGGVGIAGPQVGLGLRVAMLLLDYKTEKPWTLFAVNPYIVERSDESELGYEGCLSVPGFGGLVRRSRWIRVSYFSLTGETQTAEAEGPNAVLWQHELDHLEGLLFVDHLQGELLPMEEVRRRRRLLEQGVSLRHRPADDLEGLL